MYSCSFYADLYSEHPFKDDDKHITFRRRTAVFSVLFTDPAVSLADGDWSHSAVKSTYGFESRGCFCPLTPVFAAAQLGGESI